jgi:hypothetical protein
MKYIVNPGKCVSSHGRSYASGGVVELNDAAAKRLLAKGAISDPSKPLSASLSETAQAEIDNFKRNPPVKKDKKDNAPDSGGDQGGVEDAVKNIVG